MSVSVSKLQQQVEALLNAQTEAVDQKLELFSEVILGLDLGIVRVADRRPDGDWQVRSWVKQVILWGFKYGRLIEIPGYAGSFYDKDTLELKKLSLHDQVRMVPGGSVARKGSYLAPGVIVMPPSYINIGAYVDRDTMIDSHVLVGSGAQVGCRVHLSAGVQIGGVLEPIGSLPVIVEDDAFIGGSCGIYEGVIVGERAVLASGVVLNHSVQIFDQVHDCFITAQAGAPLMIPPGAVLVPGSRPLKTRHALAHQIQVSCPVIVKYRDARTDNALTLEESLRI